MFIKLLNTMRVKELKRDAENMLFVTTILS